jgi:hypothetical protein
LDQAPGPLIRQTGVSLNRSDDARLDLPIARLHDGAASQRVCSVGLLNHIQHWRGLIVRFIVFAALGAVLVVATPAQAQDRRAGIEKARAAGIYVDPAVEPMMAAAPLGSCQNDPTLPQCSKAVKRIVYAPEFFGLDRARIGAASKPKARMAGQGCYLKITDQSPYKAAGLEQMDANHYCIVHIQDLDIYLALLKHYNGSWRTMINRWFWPPYPYENWWYGHLSYDCQSQSVYRHWRARADAYAEYRGTVYAAYVNRYNWDYCG